MNNIKGIFYKQMQSLVKMPLLIGQAVMFLIIAGLITFFLTDEDCEDCIPAYVCAACIEAGTPDSHNPSLGGTFVVMFIGLVLLNSASALVSEDRNTKNLRFMAMANVKPVQYLFGTAPALIIISLILIPFFSLVGLHFGFNMLRFVSIATAGMIVSVILGVTAGLSKYPYLVFPFSMIAGFGPMLSNLNPNLARFMRFAYTQQVNLAVGELEADMSFNFMVIGISGLVAILLFVLVHRNGRLQV